MCGLLCIIFVENWTWLFKGGSRKAQLKEQRDDEQDASLMVKAMETADGEDLAPAMY